MWLQAAHAVIRSRQPNAQLLQGLFSRVAHRRGLRTALAAVPVATLSALMFSLAVLSTLISISMTPKNQNISTGQTQQYTATGTYSYASTNNITNQVTWSSSSTSVATINSSGSATAVAAGTTTISATLSGKTGSAPLTVPNPVAGGVFCGGKNGTAALPNCDPNNPTANTVFDTTMPDTSGYTVVPVSAGSATDLQNKINAASCRPNGTVLKLVAGSTYSGQFNLPNKNCAAGRWIIIQSDSSSIPAPGTRVDPTYASFMPKIQSTGGLPSIVVSQRANHYRFIGIEFNAVYPGFEVTNLLELDVFDSQGNPVTNASLLASYIIIDRSYIHGDTNTSHDYRRGIAMDVSFSAVIDSYINQIHDTGADCQTIGVPGNGAKGPFKIVNNYLSASGENILFGGGTAGISNVVPSDIEIRHNHFFKPTTWQNTAIVVKNLLEFKTGARILLDGNVLEQTWYSAQQHIFTLTPLQSDSGANAQVVDITATHNIMRHAPGGIQVYGADSGSSGLGVQRLLFQNNLVADINGVTWAGAGGIGGGGFGDSASNCNPPAPCAPFNSTFWPQTVVFDHNTVLITGGSGPSSYGFGGGCHFQISGFQWTNNIISRGTYGFSDFQCGKSEGLSTLNYYTPGYSWNKNALINNTHLSSIYPPGTFFPTTSGVGFTDYISCSTGTSTGNCALLSSSPYHNAGADGKDIGADINSINRATVGVIQVHD